MITRSLCSWTPAVFFHQPYPQPSSLSSNLYDSLVFGTGTLEPFDLSYEAGRWETRLSLLLLCAKQVLEASRWTGLSQQLCVWEPPPRFIQNGDFRKGYLSVLRSQSLHRRGCPLPLTPPSGCSAVLGLSVYRSAVSNQRQHSFLSLLHMVSSSFEPGMGYSSPYAAFSPPLCLLLFTLPIPFTSFASFSP